ncbi:amidohydrolase family protein [Paenibacillus polymyxa]|uniref:amidohydrolase family protein n=1 Tax=Paenibacillus polymyxa TaxID=1406 RepID=UPI00201DA6C7|nr:amidohydrolase family protein [Paenibacillus polymyxa]
MENGTNRLSSCLFPVFYIGLYCIDSYFAGWVSHCEMDTSLTKVNETVKGNSRLVYDSMLKGLRQAVEHEIGTDAAMSYVTHYDIWRELDHYMRQTKLNAGQVIERVTKSNAEILGIDHLTGSIDTGKQADLIVLEHNPLDNIKALSNVAMVMVRGNLIPTPSVTRIQEVDALLDSVWQN